MGIFGDTRFAPRRNLLPAILGVFLALTGCGAPGGEMQNNPSIPVFTSAPGTAASQGETYTYQITTVPAVGAVTLALASAPSAATLNGSTLTWTPSAAQSRVANQFSVTATSSGGSSTQSWSVTPAGMVSGTWVNTEWTPNGPVLMPVDLTKAPFPPSALVPQTDGSFQTVIGSGNSDGTFSIPNIPGGYYWLKPAANFYWTSSSTFDFGLDLNGANVSATASVTTTTLDFDFAGLDPLQTQDEVGFLPEVSGPVSFVYSASSPSGATSLNETTQITGNLDFSQINSGFLMQYEPETLGALNFLVLGPEATLSNLALSNGTTNTISGTLNPSPQASFDLNLKGSAWNSLFENVGPASSTVLGSDLSVTSQPFMSGSNVLAGSPFTVSLLFDPQPGFPPMLGPISLLSGPESGFLPPTPGEPPVTADQDFGIAQFEDPFPTAWPRIFTFSQTGSVNVPLPGSTTPVAFWLVDRQSVPLPSSQIAPLIGQVQNPTINGKRLYVANTVGPAGVTLSWTAPSGAMPTGYKIATYVAGVVTGFGPAYFPSVSFYTAKTSATLPPLQAGKTYVFLIGAILDGAANFETQPNRSALPTASVSVVSAPITISAGS